MLGYSGRLCFQGFFFGASNPKNQYPCCSSMKHLVDIFVSGSPTFAFFMFMIYVEAASTSTTHKAEEILEDKSCS